MLDATVVDDFDNIIGIVNWDFGKQVYFGISTVREILYNKTRRYCICGNARKVEYGELNKNCPRDESC